MTNLVRHLKTGNHYQVMFLATDATNDTRGRSMVVYRSVKDGQLYVREKAEFAEKFEEVGRTL